RRHALLEHRPERARPGFAVLGKVADDGSRLRERGALAGHILANRREQTTQAGFEIALNRRRRSGRTAGGRTEALRAIAQNVEDGIHLWRGARVSHRTARGRGRCARGSSLRRETPARRREAWCWRGE